MLTQAEVICLHYSVNDMEDHIGMLSDRIEIYFLGGAGWLQGTD